jgi:bacterioferritin
MEIIESKKTSAELFSLLNAALARELKVSVLYMLQHAIWSGKTSGSKSELKEDKQKKFVASHAPVFFPGVSLKKTAIQEMRHAEKIAERITLLEGDIIKEVPPFTIGDSPEEILEINKKEEGTAIELYRRIIRQAKEEGDDTTAKMFKRILSDEENHFKTFSNQLEMIK